MLGAAGQIVGYLGVIPTIDEDPSGKPIPALIATTWAVAADQRNAVLPMGMMLQRQSRLALCVDTTPSPEEQALLNRWGWTSRTQIRRSLIIRGISLASLAGLIRSVHGHAQSRDATRRLLHQRHRCPCRNLRVHRLLLQYPTPPLLPQLPNPQSLLGRYRSRKLNHFWSNYPWHLNLACCSTTQKHAGRRS